jgi:glutamyl-tRNA synthetase
MADVVTRFAPSPTGALHVGGARTALLNWAYARRHGGTFVLRVEDTDRKRSSEEATRGILRDLMWLGLDWDAGPDSNDPAAAVGELGPYFQSQRLDTYRTAVQQLIDAGLARTDDGAVRFSPPAGVAFDDAVYGHIEVAAEDIGEFVIQKADGFPTFHLAVVVDDDTMGVTHVIRGQEHLSNTPKHIALQEALGYRRPVYVHTPSIMNPDGSKMSKRDKAKAARAAAERDGWPEVLPGVDADALQAFKDKKSDELEVALQLAHALGEPMPEIDVADFRASGYTPGALLNYLALLGWSHPDGAERFELPDFVQQFGPERINKSNAKFDREKLLAFNAERLQQMDAQRFATLLRRHLRAHDPRFVAAFDGSAGDALAAAYQPRCKRLADVAEAGVFLVCDDSEIVYDAKAVKKNLHKGDGAGLSALRAVREVLAEPADWAAEALEQRLQALADELGCKHMGGVAQPLRVAVSGAAVTPPIGLTLQLLGRDVVLRRIERCLEMNGIDAAAS